MLPGFLPCCGREVAVNPRTTEAAFIAVIGLAVLLGGRSLLVEIAQFRAAAFIVLLTIGAALLRNLSHHMAPRTPLGRFLATRDIAFTAALIAALAFVASPARWALGTTLAAFEFGLVLELVARAAERRSADETAK